MERLPAPASLPLLPRYSPENRLTRLYLIRYKSGMVMEVWGASDTSDCIHHTLLKPFAWRGLGDTASRSCRRRSR